MNDAKLSCMFDKLISLSKEIIEICDFVIKDNSSPNIGVVEIIKREFEEQIVSLTEQKKAIVLNKGRDLWAVKTIIDSAYFDYDKELFDKVYEFKNLVQKVSKKNLTVLY